jgi:hypothetical protein
MLSIRGLNQQTEALYIYSINRSLRALRRAMTDYDRVNHYISNRDLDTGVVVKPSCYSLADQTYAKLLAKLTEH